MSNPLETVAVAGVEQFPVRCYLANVTAVDVTAGECTIDIGDGQPLTGVIYVGRPVIIGQQVLLITFRRNAVVVGGNG